jgi:hypothetical protein
MLEYVFFEKEPRQRFEAFLDKQGVPWTLEPGHPESVVVVDDTRIDATVADRLESLYDELFALEQSLFVSDKVQSQARPKGVPVHLKDGSTLHADLPQELVNRLLTVISPEELDLIADAIVCAFEDSEGQAAG